MLHGKSRMVTVILMACALLVGGATLSFAMGCNTGGSTGSGGTTTSTTWGCGQNWTGGTGMGWTNGMWGGMTGRHGTQFMAHGEVVSVDTQASTITISLEAASPSLLTTLSLTTADLPTNVTLQVKSTVKVWGCGWHNSSWGSGTVTLAGLKAGQDVNLMGSYDSTTGDPLVSRINVWFY